MGIREVFKTLAPEERECLMCAFNQGFPKHIVLRNGTFIGVNVEFIQYLEPTETEGHWSIGKVKQ